MLVAEKISGQIQIFPKQAEGIFKTTKTNKQTHTQAHKHTCTQTHEHTHKHALTNKLFTWTYNFCGHYKHIKLNNIHI